MPKEFILAEKKKCEGCGGTGVIQLTARKVVALMCSLCRGSGYILEPVRFLTEKEAESLLLSLTETRSRKE